jgi:hypothetical protein
MPDGKRYLGLRGIWWVLWPSARTPAPDWLARVAERSAFDGQADGPRSASMAAFGTCRTNWCGWGRSAFGSEPDLPQTYWLVCLTFAKTFGV